MARRNGPGRRRGIVQDESRRRVSHLGIGPAVLGLRIVFGLGLDLEAVAVSGVGAGESVVRHGFGPGGRPGFTGDELPESVKGGPRVEVPAVISPCRGRIEPRQAHLDLVKTGRRTETRVAGSAGNCGDSGIEPGPGRRQGDGRDRHYRVQGELHVGGGRQRIRLAYIAYGIPAPYVQFVGQGGVTLGLELGYEVRVGIRPGAARYGRGVPPVCRRQEVFDRVPGGAVPVFYRGTDLRDYQLHAVAGVDAREGFGVNAGNNGHRGVRQRQRHGDRGGRRGVVVDELPLDVVFQVAGTVQRPDLYFIGLAFGERGRPGLPGRRIGPGSPGAQLQPEMGVAWAVIGYIKRTAIVVIVECAGTVVILIAGVHVYYAQVNAGRRHA